MGAYRGVENVVSNVVLIETTRFDAEWFVNDDDHSLWYY